MLSYGDLNICRRLTLLKIRSLKLMDLKTMIKKQLIIKMKPTLTIRKWLIYHKISKNKTIYKLIITKLTNRNIRSNNNTKFNKMKQNSKDIRTCRPNQVTMK